MKIIDKSFIKRLSYMCAAMTYMWLGGCEGFRIGQMYYASEKEFFINYFQFGLLYYHLPLMAIPALNFYYLHRYLAWWLNQNQMISDKNAGGTDVHVGVKQSQEEPPEDKQ